MSSHNASLPAREISVDDPDEPVASSPSAGQNPPEQRARSSDMNSPNLMSSTSQPVQSTTVRLPQLSTRAAESTPGLTATATAQSSHDALPLNSYENLLLPWTRPMPTTPRSDRIQGPSVPPNSPSTPRLQHSQSTPRLHTPQIGLFQTTPSSNRTRNPPAAAIAIFRERSQDTSEDAPPSPSTGRRGELATTAQSTSSNIFTSTELRAERFCAGCHRSLPTYQFLVLPSARNVALVPLSNLASRCYLCRRLLSVDSAVRKARKSSAVNRALQESDRELFRRMLDGLGITEEEYGQVLETTRVRTEERIQALEQRQGLQRWARRSLDEPLAQSSSNAATQSANRASMSNVIVYDPAAGDAQQRMGLSRFSDRTHGQAAPQQPDNNEIEVISHRRYSDSRSGYYRAQAYTFPRPLPTYGYGPASSTVGGPTGRQAMYEPSYPAPNTYALAAYGAAPQAPLPSRATHYRTYTTYQPFHGPIRTNRPYYSTYGQHQVACPYQPVVRESHTTQSAQNHTHPPQPDAGDLAVGGDVHNAASLVWDMTTRGVEKWEQRQLSRRIRRSGRYGRRTGGGADTRGGFDEAVSGYRAAQVESYERTRPQMESEEDGEEEGEL